MTHTLTHHAMERIYETYNGTQAWELSRTPDGEVSAELRRQNGLVVHR